MTTRPAPARLALLAAVGLLAGCTTSPPPQPPVPEPLVGQATLPGYPADIRHIHGFNEEAFIADFQAAMRAAPDTPEGVAILSLSGGGPNGAYGAGVLVGWTETGRRPEFQVVTGVSTGALAAPFAFLGPDYDDRLTFAYTAVQDDDLYRAHVLRSMLALFRSDAVTDDNAFQETLAGLITPPMLEAIADEYRRGRRLYVGTHELVSGRAVYWNLTAIAASGRPDALDLFRKVLLASASVPILFPPQYFTVEAGGQAAREIHVDGGLSRQAFLHMNGARAGLPPRADGAERPLTAYLIRNGRAVVPYRALTPTVPHIAQRTIEALVTAEGIGDLYRIYSQTIEERAAYRLIMLPDDAPHRHTRLFDPELMRRLFDLGRAAIKADQPWSTQPPYLSPIDGS